MEIDDYISACDEVHEGSTGTITSPNYPQHYDNNMRVEYCVSVESGKVRSISHAGKTEVYPMKYARGLWGFVILWP